jgi:hypothetical protein
MGKELKLHFSSLRGEYADPRILEIKCRRLSQETDAFLKT